MEKTFLLGVGAQKSGTTWLHNYVSNVDGANFGFSKEYHIWDAVSSELCAGFRLPENAAGSLNTRQFLRYCMQNIDGFYEGYFRSILNSGFHITGDITPSYCVLNSEQLRTLREKISGTGAKIKVVFLMRDPLERCWSAVRMQKRNRKEEESDEENLSARFSSPRFDYRTRYETICENIKASFSEEEIYFGIYETMFDHDEISRLSEFLGIRPNYSLIEKRPNASPKLEIVSDDLKSRVRDHYADTYQYCHEHFPETIRLWGNQQRVGN